MRKTYMLPVHLIALTAMIALVATGCKKENEDPVPVADIDGNIYSTVVIGTQVWLGENLKTTTYANGDPISLVTDGAEWPNLNSGAYCEYDNSSALTSTYGLLYNWHAANDPRNLCPDGWHVPTYNDWDLLLDFLGGESVAGGKLKEKGTTHWLNTSAEVTDAYGFSALAAGYRFGGTFEMPGHYAIFWSSSEKDADDGWILSLTGSSVEAYIQAGYKTDGFSVRCIKD